MPTVWPVSVKLSRKRQTPEQKPSARLENQYIFIRASCNLWQQEREEELTRRLEGFQSSKPRELTPYEGRSLVALLHCDDKDKIARTLVTISNCAAFTRNQSTMREAGVLVRLPALLATEEREVQLAAAMAASNLALNTANMKEMEQVVLVLVILAEDPTRCYNYHQLKSVFCNLGFGCMRYLFIPQRSSKFVGLPSLSGYCLSGNAGSVLL